MRVIKQPLVSERPAVPWNVLETSFQHLSAHFSVLFPSSWQRKFEKLVCLLILVIAAELSHNLSQFD